MPKTKEIEIICDEIRCVPNNRLVRIVVDSPNIDTLFQSIVWSDIVEFVQSENPNPEDIFSKEQLETWAAENGYIKG